MPDASLLEVLFLSTLTALATGLGAVPFWRVRPGAGWLRLGNAAAAGLMLSASGAVALEGFHSSVPSTLAGGVLGAAFVWASRYWLRGGEEVHVGALRGAAAREALLIVGVMTVHSAAEGVGLGVSFAGGREVGLFVSTAIAVHNIPEGLAIALVLVPRGVSVPAAAGWSVFSSLPQPLLAVPAFLTVNQFAPLLPWGFGFAAGAMLWLVVSELLPDAFEGRPRRWPATVLVAALILMSLFQLALQG